MKTRILLPLLAALMLLAPPAAASAALPAPPRAVYVYDGADALSIKAEEELLAVGGAVEANCNGAQITCAVVPSMDGEDIEGYANRLFREWGIGSDDEDNGVLLLIAMREREARIEVGYGLEGALPDARAGRILDNDLIPYMRQGDVDAAAVTAYRAIAEYVMAEYGQDAASLPEGGVYGQSVMRELEGEVSVGPLVVLGIALLGILLDCIFNRARVTKALMMMAFLRGGRRGGRGGRGGGGFGGGGFGGGSSGGGGASRGW